jgi:hypothetical protein
MATLSLTKAKGGRERGGGQDQFSTRFLSMRRKKAPTTSWEVAEALGGGTWESEQVEQLSYEELLSVLDCGAELPVRCEHLLTDLS